MSRSSADGADPDGRAVSDERLARLNGDEPAKSTVDAHGGPEPWPAPDRPSAQPSSGTDAPEPLPPPTSGPQWTMEPASTAHPVAPQYGRPPATGRQPDPTPDIPRSTPAPIESETDVEDATRVLGRPPAARGQSTVSGSGQSGESRHRSSHGDGSAGILPAGAPGNHGASRHSAPAGGPDVAGPPAGQPPTVEQLTAQSLLRERRPTPQTGWRRAVYNLTAHTLNPGQSPEDRRREELIARATVPVAGCYRIAVISLKGGVGKTTTTVTLGATLASLRGDRVIAVDANPDRGTLSGKIPVETVATVRNLLNEVHSIQHYFDVRRYTSQSADRLEVLASESDPAVSTAFSEADYRAVASVLERFYNIVLTDCGTGLLHSAMRGVLDLADQIVLVSSGSVDGARSASATLDWLEAHGRSALVRNSVAVINSVRPKSGGVDLDRLDEHFAARCRAVARIPYDPHLEEGAEVELGELSSASRASLLELAAYVADAFPRLPRRPYGPRS